jgi:hypothetical protein
MLRDLSFYAFSWFLALTEMREQPGFGEPAERFGSALERRQGRERMALSASKGNCI